MSQGQNKPEIGSVLKALNHPIRREVLLYLDQRKMASFTDLHQHVEKSVKSTGQFSYHLNLLVDTGILRKQDDSYTLTTIGERATDMIQLIDIEVDSSVSQQISNSFNQLSPREQVTLSWMIVPLILFAVLMSSNLLDTLTALESTLITILAALLIAAAAAYSYSKLQYLPALIALTNVIWIFFLNGNHLTFFVIYLASGIGTAMILTGLLAPGSLWQVLAGLALLILALGVTTRYLLQESRRGIQIRIR